MIAHCLVMGLAHNKYSCRLSTFIGLWFSSHDTGEGNMTKESAASGSGQSFRLERSGIAPIYLSIAYQKIRAAVNDGT